MKRQQFEQRTRVANGEGTYGYYINSNVPIQGVTNSWMVIKMVLHLPRITIRITDSPPTFSANRSLANYTREIFQQFEQRFGRKQLNITVFNQRCQNDSFPVSYFKFYILSRYFRRNVYWLLSIY